MYQTILYDFDIHMLMDSGQVFRICPCGENTYVAASGSHLVRIRQTPSVAADTPSLPGSGAGREGACVEFSCSPGEFASYWHNYFDLATDYGAMKQAVDPGDSFLLSAVSYGGGIRILRQDLWETILVSSYHRIIIFPVSARVWMPFAAGTGISWWRKGFFRIRISTPFLHRKQLQRAAWKDCRDWGLAIGINIFWLWHFAVKGTAERNFWNPCKTRGMTKRSPFSPKNSVWGVRWPTVSACLGFTISGLFLWIPM